MRKTSRHLYVILLNVVAVVSIHSCSDGTDIASNNDQDADFTEEITSMSQSEENDEMMESYQLSEELDYTSTKPRPSARNEFEQKLLDAEIFDDVIRDTMPEKCLKVTMKHGDLIPGQRLTLLQAWHRPTVTYEADPKHLYTLFLSCYSKYIPFSSESLSKNDLPKLDSESAKWLVINIPGNNISAGKFLYNYTPPSRHHQKQLVDRYTFLLYKQRYKIKDEWLPDPIHGDFYRSGEINESYSFAQYYKLGNPIAANFFIMHW